jgi:hypothetical protein
VTTQPEPERDRLARNLSELLQELRVAQAGVQILFGFLLTVVFTQRYESMLFRRSRREKIVHSGNWTALGGLVCVAGAMIAPLGLVVDVVLGRGWAAVAGSAFVLLWFVLPLSLR